MKLKFANRDRRPQTKEAVYLRKFNRLKGKSLRQVLLYRFLNQYGYDKGEVTAKAIVEDILSLIERYYVYSANREGIHLSQGQLVWLAPPIDEFPKRGKTIPQTKMKPVILTFVSQEDIESIKDGFKSRELRLRRLERWTNEAYDQGALLTQLDLAILLNVCDSLIGEYMAEYHSLTGKLLPTRGNIQDMGAGITHKTEIISLHLQGYLTPTIAVKTNHSKEAVERYIRDYEVVKLLADKFDDPEKISLISRLSKKVVSQYLDLIPNDKLSKNKKSKTSSAF
jgi:hypothetical protein